MKVGDKVVYINNDKYINRLLILNNIYTIKHIASEIINDNDFIFYTFEETEKTRFNSKYFISLTEHRRTQIEKIKNRINATQ